MSSPSGRPHNIFQGTRFWLSREVPQRSRFKDLITKHGGLVTLMENDANVRLVDHTKRNIPTGCHSFQYIEECIRKGTLVDLEAHRAGSSRPRAMGASNLPKKGTRSAYTLEDDQLIYDFLYPFEQEKNAPVFGNKIYQLLERRFPGHTWQSSRTRYLKRLRGNPRPGGGIPRLDLLRSEPQTGPHDSSATTTPSSQAAPPQTMSSMQITPTQQQPRSSAGQIEKQVRSKRKHSAPHESPPEQRVPPKKQAIAGPTHKNNSLQDSPQQPPVSVTPKPASEKQQELIMQEILQDEVDTFFSELPFLSPTPELDGETLNEKNDDEDDQEEDDKLMEWIDLQMSRGFDDAVIDDALCCTSLNCELAEKVLSTLAAGNPIPDDIPGVWTAKDDEALQAPDSRDVMRVIQKHGGTSYEDRWTYLSEARERDMI